MSANDVWGRIGDQNPFFGVLTDAKYLGQHLEHEARGEFYRTGEFAIQDRIKLMKSIWGDFDPADLTAVDFGCGVGRLLIPLAKSCKQAIGVDISAGMLRKAEEELKSQGVGNASLLLYESELSSLQGGVNWLHSDIVFQHIPVEQGYQLFDQLLSKMGAPAFLTVQFTIFKQMRLLEHLPKALYLKQKETAEYALIGTRMAFERFTADGMSMYDYDLDKIAAILIKNGFRTFVTSFHEMGVSESALIMARRA